MTGAARRIFAFPGLALAVALSGAIACAPMIQAPGQVATAPKLADDYLVTPDGRRLPLRIWKPAAAAPKGKHTAAKTAPPKPWAAVVALHGMNDYSYGFDLPAKAWAKDGIVTYAYDQRGFGATDPKGIWPGVGTMIADLRTAVDLVHERHPGLPVYVVGVSMGGGVALAAMGGPNPPKVDGVVLVAPAVWSRKTMPSLYTITLALAAHTLPQWRLTGRDIDRRPTDNIALLRQMGRDPLVQKGARVDAIWGVVNLMDRAAAAAPSVTTPVLLLYGAKDKIIPKKPVRAVAAALPRRFVRVAYYPSGWHLLLRDKQRAVVHRDVVAWIRNRRAALPSGADNGTEAAKLTAGR